MNKSSNSSLTEIVRGSIFGMFGKFLAAGINFLSLPILLGIYGKAEYGLVGVAMATNTFLAIMNMGVPTGAVKHFSEWVESKNYKALANGIQSNLLFFTVVAFINSSILIFLGLNADVYFNTNEPKVLSNLIYILAGTSFVSWYFISFQHLLMAHEKLSAVNSYISLGSILNILAVGAAYFFNASLEVYFLIYTTTSLITIPLNILLCKKIGVLKALYFFPAFHKTEFKLIIKYSSGLFVMGIFQYIANQIQPLLLGTMGQNGDVAVANYRILQNITMLVSLMGGIFLQNFVPYITKVNLRGDLQQMQSFVLSSTRYLSLLIFFICFYIFFNSAEILTAYVGPEDSIGLAIWLQVWSIGLLFLNNQGISSLILSSGNFKQITIGIFIASVTTLSFSLLFIDRFGVGVAAIGYLIYKGIEGAFLYFYYLPKVGNISPKIVVQRSIIKPLILAFVANGSIFYLLNTIGLPANLLFIMFSFGFSIVLFIFLVFIIELNRDERQNALLFINKLRNRD